MGCARDRGRYKPVRISPTIGQSISLWHRTTHLFVIWSYKIYLFSPALEYSTDQKDKSWLHDRLRAHSRTIPQNRSFADPKSKLFDFWTFIADEAYPLYPAYFQLAKLLSRGTMSLDNLKSPLRSFDRLFSSCLVDT